MTLRDGFIEVDGLRLHYSEWGDASAQPMVILHGLGECARSWHRFHQEMPGAFEATVRWFLQDPPT